MRSLENVESTDPNKPRPRPQGAQTEPFFYVVKGCGLFPEDMLRYDQSWAITGINKVTPQKTDLWSPEQENDARLILQPERSVILATWAERGVPSARWASFGWAVKDRRISKPNFLP